MFGSLRLVISSLRRNIIVRFISIISFTVRLAANQCQTYCFGESLSALSKFLCYDLITCSLFFPLLLPPSLLPSLPLSLLSSLSPPLSPFLSPPSQRATNVRFYSHTSTQRDLQEEGLHYRTDWKDRNTHTSPGE